MDDRHLILIKSVQCSLMSDLTAKTVEFTGVLFGIIEISSVTLFKAF